MAKEEAATWPSDDPVTHDLIPMTYLRRPDPPSPPHSPRRLRKKKHIGTG